ncbi:MAG: STAS domain-containing protein [Psychrilyobacter sp.]|nr:STAS domain-containing protein [Psychrilyobacter sp.]
MNSNFELIETEVNGIKVIKITGELDAMVAPKLKERLAALVENETYNFVINCEELGHINSLAMGILRGKLREVKGFNGDIKLSNLNDHIKTIFEMIGLDEIFEIYTTEEEALAKF